MSKPVIRNYNPKDLPDVVRLYNSSGVEVPFHFRDRDYFHYFTSYPGVKEDSIFVAVSEHGIKGVAIIAVVQGKYTLGKIIELWASEATAENALLQKAVEYCRNNDIDVVEVMAPTFLDSGETFAGWQRIDQGEVMMVKPLSLVPLLQALFDTTTLREIGDRKGYLLVCDDETIEVKINKTEAKIVEGGKSWRDWDGILVTVSSKSLLEVVFGSTNPYIALLTRQIRIRGIKNILRVIKMLRAIRVNQRWTVAIVDSR